MVVKDFKGIRLYAASTVTSSGAIDMSFDKKFAVPIPPRFLLHIIY